MAFRGILQLSGVWLNANTTQAGYRSLNDLSGAIITSVPVIGNAGYRSALELSGLWITGAVSDVAVPESFSGGWFDYEKHRPRFKAVGKEQRKAKRFVEEIATKVLATSYIETNEDIELILRLKLKQQGLIYKNLYLRWLVNEAEIERKAKARKRRNKIAMLLLLH